MIVEEPVINVLMHFRTHFASNDTITKFNIVFST